jgi:glucokinase
MSDIYAGVDLGGTSFIAVLSDRKGKVLGSSDCATIPGAKAEDTMQAIADHVRLAAKDAGVKIRKVKALGIGAPGAVDVKTGLVVKAPNLGWTNVPLAATLKKELGPDVVLGNDVQVAIIGEHAYGAAKGTDRAVGIWVGTGIGGGLINNGELDRGFRGAAGEIGHMFIKEDGPQCGCGRIGCVEALASRTAMEREMRALAKKSKGECVSLNIMKERNKERMTSSIIQRGLKADCAVMKEVVAKAQYYLGLLAGNLVNMYDPEMIVIGGGVAQRLKDDFVGPIAETARARFLRPDPNKTIRIEAATLGDYSGALGASALARKLA